MGYNRGATRGLATRAILLAAVLAIPLVSGLQAAPEPEEEDKGSLNVFVPDSSVAQERLTLTDKLEKAGEWGKASEIYQELLDSYRDRVVEAEGSSDAAPVYISVVNRVLERLSRWPAEGLAIYNGRYEPAASQLLQQVRDPSDLQTVVDRFLLTKSGRVAAQRLMQIWWDHGETAAVARMAQQLVGTLPPAADGRAQLLFESALAWQMAGYGDRAKAVLEQLRKDYPGAQGEVAGKTVELASELEKSLGAVHLQREVAAGWTQYGGSADRAATPTAAGRSDALLFSIPVTSPARQEDASLITPRQIRTKQSQAIGIFPVHDRRQLFFQDGASLHGVSLDGGMKLPGWPATSVPISQTRSTSASLRTLALTEESIYAVSSDVPSAFPVWVGPSSAGGASDSGVVCVDRATGRIAWRFKPSSQTTPAIKTAQIASPPLVVGEQLFVAARGGRNAQFNDIYVLCLSRRTGKLLWSSYVASGPNLNLAMMDDVGMPAETGLPQLSFHAGRVVVLTNVGVIAALESIDGSPAWIRAYARVQPPTSTIPGLPPMMPPNAYPQTPGIFASSPPIVSEGNVFALPMDGKNLLVLDENDGHSLKEIPRASLQNVNTLAGLLGDQLVLSSERVATVLDWRKAEPENKDQKQAIHWTMNFPQPSAVGFRGRPFLTSDSLYLTSDERLLRVSTAHWKIEQMTPRYPATWETGEGPGNVLVSDENVIVATAKRVNVYTNLAAATARLDREVTASPSSPDPLVRYCELLLAAGHGDEALAKLQTAAEVAKGNPQVTPEQRNRLFSSALSCAKKLAVSDDAAMQQMTDRFMDAASQAIASPAQTVEYHLSAADMRQRRNDDLGMLRELQTVLNEPPSRGVLYRDLDGQMRYSGEVARRRIAILISRRGRDIYQATEQLAQKQLGAAQGAQDIAGLIETAKRYPNSAAAPAALVAAARMQEEAMQLPAAALTLRQLVQDYPNHPDAPSFAESLARVYAATPGKAHIAAARLMQAAATMNDPALRGALRLPDGQMIREARFSEAAKALRSMSGIERTTPLPDFHLPEPGHDLLGMPTLVSGVVVERMLDPMPNAPTDYHRAVAMTGPGELIVLDESGKVVTRLAPGLETPATDYAWAGASQLLVRSGKEMAMLDIDKRAVVWKLDVSTLPEWVSIPEDANTVDSEDDGGAGMELRGGAAVRVAGQQRAMIRMLPPALGGAARVARETLPELRDVAIAGKRIVFGTGSGQFAAVDLASGKLLWQFRSEGMSVSRVVACDDFAGAKLTSGTRSVAMAVDSETGKLAFRKSYMAEVLQNVAMSDDGKLVYTLPDRLVCKDLFDQSDRTLYEVPASSAVAFLNLTHPDHLLLTDSTVVALCDSGTQVRTYSLFTGKQVAPGARETTDPVALSVRASQPGAVDTHLVLAEPYVYAWNAQWIRAMNLQKSEAPERNRTPGNYREVIAGKGHLITVETPAFAGEVKNVPYISLTTFSRTQTRSGESGLILHNPFQVKTPAGITSWQLLESGLYAITAEGKLLYLPVGK